MKKLRILAAIVVGTGIAIQFIRPERNVSPENSGHISGTFDVPPDVQTILENACYDCHSNTTRYPWYANIQPVAWLIRHDVEEGTKHLNFSRFSAESVRRQFHRLEEIEDQITEKEMPPPAYQWLHPEAELSDPQRARLIEWSNIARGEMKAKFPVDSLIRER